MKAQLKERAIGLRKRGLTYSEILGQVPVAKSTLSLWLRSVGLSRRQKQELTQKKLAAARRGGEVRRKQRIAITKKIKKEALSEVDSISKRDLWLMGVMLYWAEGAKAKGHNPSQRVSFSNSDPQMIKIFVRWLDEVLKVPYSRVGFDIFLHESHKGRENAVKKFWADVCGFSVNKFDKIYYKKNKVNTKRKNIGDSYRGLLRINIAKSTNLNRKISGWTEGIIKQCGVV